MGLQEAIIKEKGCEPRKRQLPIRPFKTEEVENGHQYFVCSSFVPSGEINFDKRI
jgi:hypothetical protein